MTSFVTTSCVLRLATTIHSRLVECEAPHNLADVLIFQKRLDPLPSQRLNAVVKRAKEDNDAHVVRTHASEEIRLLNYDSSLTP